MKRLAGAVLGVWALVGCNPSASVVPKSSGSIAISQDDARLYVVDPDHHRLNVLDARTGDLLQQVPVGRNPERVLVGADGSLFVTNRGDRTVTRLSADGQVVAQGEVGAEPVGMTLDRDGKKLLVANSMSGTVTVLDGQTLVPVDEFDVGGRPWALAAHPDGKRVYVTDYQSGWVSVVDLNTRAVERTVTLEQPAGTECRWGGAPARTPAQPADVVLSPDGERVYVAHVQSRTGVETGTQQSLALAVAPSLATLTTADDVHQKEPQMGEQSAYPAAMLATNLDESCQFGGGAPGMDAPSSLVVDGSGQWIFVADHNSDAIAVVSANRYRMEGMRDPERGIYDVVRVGARPTGIAVSGDLRTAYVHNALDYSVSVVRNEGGRLSQTSTWFFDKSDLPEAIERGRRLFYSAVDPRVTQPEFGGVSCSSCHPNGGTDGLNWVLPDPGNAQNEPWNWADQQVRPIRNTPALWGVTGTAPYHWDGMLADMPAFSSHMVAQMGGGGLVEKEVADLTAYLGTLAPPDNPNLAADAAVLQHGQAVFAQRCESCHAGAALTDLTAHRTVSGDVTLDTPSLRGVFATAPYLHHGGARSLRTVVMGGSYTVEGHDHRTMPESDFEALEAWLKTR